MKKYLEKLWKNLRLKNQIWILQGFAIVLTFSILILLSYEMVMAFYDFIQHELLQSLILRSMISTIQNTVLRVGRIGKIGYYQQLADQYSLKNLYFFYAENNIQMNYQLDNCLQTVHTKEFYSYQFCYGIYGQISNSTDFNQIKQFVALQNLFLPLQQLETTKANYNLLLDQSLFFSQYKGEYLNNLTKEIQDAKFFMEFFQLPGYFKQVIGETGQMLLIFNVIAGTKIAIGYMYNQNQQLYYKLTSRKEYFQQRSISVMESGIILTDTKYLDIYGLYFQNTSLTGFNENQFEKIKNSIKDNNTVENECQQQVKSKVLCLVDVDKQEKLIFPEFVNNGFQFYVIVIADAKRLQDIQDDFNQQVQQFINTIIINMVVSLKVTLLSCLIIQLILVLKLNKPLQKLQDFAKFHTKGQLYLMMSSMKLIKAQSQLQQLTDAFLNLVNQINSKTKSELFFNGKLDDQMVKYSGGVLLLRYYRQGTKLIRSYFRNIKIE